jgi:hypothetical protein
MARDVFVDTSGFYALLVDKDAKHVEADRILRAAGAEKRRLVTTDYVLCETATLLRARGHAQLCEPLFERVLDSPACRILWTTPDRFHKLRAFFQKHSDQEWSFTDCLSFYLMKELGVYDALTKDTHFEQAGFVALLK